MLDYIKNQRGSSLAIALIIIVLFSILGLGLVTLNASASKQFTNKEQQVQARHFAEMGLVHYKSEAVDTLVEHNSVLNGFNTSSSTEEEKVDLINSENDKLCNKLIDSTEILTPINATKPQYYNISILDCDFNFNKTEVNVNIRSEGKSIQGKVETIDLDLLIELPGTLRVGTGHSGDGSKTPPGPPNPPEKGSINTSLPICEEDGNGNSNGNGKGKGNNCPTTIKEYTNVSSQDTFTLKRGNLVFEDSLVANNFRVDGGNGLQMTIKKDFYLIGDLDVQNHACIMVQGDFTASKITSKNKLYVFVYGDAYLSEDIEFTSGNNNIFVSGNVYKKNGDKYIKETKNFQSVPSSFNNVNGTTCSLPGAPTPTPTPNNPIDLGLGAHIIKTNYKY